MAVARLCSTSGSSSLPGPRASRGEGGMREVRHSKAKTTSAPRTAPIGIVQYIGVPVGPFVVVSPPPIVSWL